MENISKNFYTQRKKKKKKNLEKKNHVLFSPLGYQRKDSEKKNPSLLSFQREDSEIQVFSKSSLFSERRLGESESSGQMARESESSGQMARCSSLFSFQREDSVIQLYSLITERRLGSSKSSLFSERRLAIRRFHSKSYLFSEERLGEKTPTSKPFQKTFQSAEEVRVLVCWCVGVWVGGVVGSGLGGFRNGTYTQEKSLKA